MGALLNVYAIPSVVDPAELAGGAAVVIDVLRASTTIIHALEAGAVEVLPCLEVEEAKALAAKLPASGYVLGGERNGLPIEGFHLGNSPAEYTSAAVGGRAVIFTTTNGTRAMMRCRQAARVYIGAFVNASAVVERLIGEAQVHLLCAGSDGKITWDDALFAGLLVDWLLQRGDPGYQLNAQAATARERWLRAFALPLAVGTEPMDPQVLAGELRKGLAGQKLASIGMEADILAAAQIDRFRSVPEFDPQTLRIRLPAV